MSMGQRLCPRIPLPLLGIVFLDMLAVGLVIPLLPFMVEEVHGDALLPGILQSVYGACQVVGASFLGRRSDTLGRRAILGLSLAGALVGYFMGAVAATPAVLIASRVPVGLFKQTSTVARAVAVDCSGAESRVQALSWVGAVASAAMIVSPPVGGAITAATGSPRLPAFIATGIYVAALALTALALPETAPRLAARGKEELEQHWPPPEQAWTLLHARPAAALLLAARFAADVAFLTHQSTMVQTLQVGFGLGPQRAGVVVSLGAAAHVLAKAALLPWAARHFSPRAMAVGGAGLAAAALAASATAPAQAVYVAAVPVLTVGYALCSVSLMAAATHLVPPEAVGTLTGAADALQSVGRVFTPLAGAWALTRLGPAAPSAVATGGALAAMVLSSRGGGG